MSWLVAILKCLSRLAWDYWKWFFLSDLLNGKVYKRFRQNNPLVYTIRAYQLQSRSLEIAGSNGNFLLLRTEKDITLSDSKVWIVNIESNQKWEVQHLDVNTGNTCLDQFTAKINNKLLVIRFEYHIYKRRSQNSIHYIEIVSNPLLNLIYEETQRRGFRQKVMYHGTAYKNITSILVNNFDR